MWLAGSGLEDDTCAVDGLGWGKRRRGGGGQARFGASGFVKTLGEGERVWPALNCVCVCVCSVNTVEQSVRLMECRVQFR